MKSFPFIFILLLTNSICSTAQIYFRKTYGDPYPRYENGFSVCITSDGYIMSGQSLSVASINDGDGFFLKTNKSGTVVWQSTIEDSTNNCNINCSLIDDSSYIFVGDVTNYANGKVYSYVNIFDTTGQNHVSYFIGDSIFDNGSFCIEKSNDGNLLLAGWVKDGTGYWQGNLIKINHLGNVF